MYLTYVEYTSYGGTLDSTTFSNFDFGAEAIVDYVTFNRLQSETVIPEKVKRLVAKIIDIVYQKSESMSLGNGSSSSSGTAKYITNQSNDGVSVSYNGMPAVDLFELCDKEIQQTIRMYLNGLKNSEGKVLLYRGLYRGE